MDDFDRVFQAFIDEAASLTDEQFAELQEVMRADYESLYREGDDDAEYEGHGIEDYPPFRWTSTLTDRHGDAPWIARLQWSALRMYSRSQREQILSRGMLVSAISGLEIFVGDCVEYFYRRHPGALGKDPEQKEFSLADLTELDSLEEARELAIERRVTSLLFEPFPQWSKWFERYLGFSFSDVCIDWDDLREAVERRNIVVHNGGRVNRIYKQNLGDLASDVELREYLPLDQGYIASLILQLRVVAVLTTVLAVIKIDADFADYALSLLYDHIYRFLVDDEWEAVVRLTDGGLKLRLTEADRHLVSINQWIARRHQGEDVSDEVERIDGSALEPKFKLALDVLKGVASDDVYRAFDDLLSDGTFGLQALLEWPLFYPLGSDQRFLKLVNKHYARLAADEPSEARRLTEVLVAPNGRSFHLLGCRHADRKQIGMPRRCATQLGYVPCRSCAQT